MVMFVMYNVYEALHTPRTSPPPLPPLAPRPRALAPRAPADARECVRFLYWGEYISRFVFKRARIYTYLPNLWYFDFFIQKHVRKFLVSRCRDQNS